MSYPYPKDAGQSSNLWWTTKFVIDMVNTSANNKQTHSQEHAPVVLPDALYDGS